VFVLACSCSFGVLGHVYTDTITRIPYAGQNVQMQGARSLTSVGVLWCTPKRSRTSATQQLSVFTNVQRAKGRRRPQYLLRKDGWYLPMSAGTSRPLDN
jgi:hypothetical protein